MASTSAALNSMRHGAVAGAVLLAVLAAPDATVAGPAVCAQIERQLASPRTEPREARRYDRAIRSQQLELEKINAQIANAGCSRFLSTLRPHCSSLQASLVRMARNLAALRSGRDRASVGAGDERARLLAAYAESGCGDAESSLRTAALPAVKKDKPALFDNLYGGAEQQPAEGPPVPSAAQSYRALCVRTCDGYFFPLSSSSSPTNFTHDQQACEAACPGTDVEAFYDRVPDEDGALMTSGRSGAPYADLPGAFLYKQAGYQRPAACGCNPHKDFSVVAGQAPLPDEPAEQAPAAMAVSGQGSIVAATPLPEAEEMHAAVAGPSEEHTSSVEAPQAPKRNVRVVGPKFLPDPDESIDLRSPKQY